MSELPPIVWTALRTIRQEVILDRCWYCSILLCDRAGSRTSLHSVFVRRLYFSGFSFLHLLQTRQRKTFLKVGSMSTELHSLQRGFAFGSKYIAYERISLLQRTNVKRVQLTRLGVLQCPLPFTFLLLRSKLLVYLLPIFDKKPSLGVDHLRQIIFEVFP